MNEKDFFSKLDGTIEKNQTKHNKVDVKDKELSVFFTNEIQNITPMLKGYESKLISRGVKCELNLNENSFSFSIKHKNGDPHNLTFGSNFQDDFKSYGFVSYFRSESDGKEYKSTDAKVYTQENWSIDMVEERIQKHIEDFMIYQGRHM